MEGLAIPPFLIGVKSMASFQKRGKTWQYTVSRMVNGKPAPIRKGGFRTKKEAQIAAAEIEAELSKGVVPHLKPEPFDAYFENWLKVFKPHVANNTMQRYLNTLKTIKEYFGSKPIQEITKRDYQRFMNYYGENRARSTSDKINAHIRACVSMAIEEGIIRVDFTKGVTKSGKKGKRKEDKRLNYKDSKKLYKYLFENLDKGLNFYLLLLGLVTGMRFGEIVGLTRKDFNFFNNTINIDKSWGYTKKMHKGFGPTKNDQSVRVISVDNKVMNEFKKLFDKIPDNVHRLVFYSPKSKYKVISNGAANDLLKNILAKLKIDPISVHGLRHTHASVSLYRKASIYYVSERLGHSDIETTMNEYSHVLKEMREEDERIVTGIYNE